MLTLKVGSYQEIVDLSIMAMSAIAVALMRPEEPLTTEETDLLCQRLKGLSGQGVVCRDEQIASIVKEFSSKRPAALTPLCTDPSLH